MEFEKMAQNLVEATSHLIGGRVINIMDTKGVILASTDKTRIGTVHEGACEVIRTGRAVAIEKSEVGRYPGAKEGYNLPVMSGSRIIAVVGIFGNPSDVNDVANLLAVYVANCIEQNAVAMQKKVADELRMQYLQMLLSLAPGDQEMLASLSDGLRIQQQFPARVFVVQLSVHQNMRSVLQIFSRASEELQRGHYLLSDCDVWGVIDNRLVLVKSKMNQSEPKFCTRLYDFLSACIGGAFQLCAGMLCNGIKDVKTSYQQALSICVAGGEGVRDITDPTCKFYAMMRSTCAHEQYEIAQRYAALEQALGAEDLDILLNTADIYYAEDCSVTRAAEGLHIHKNTLQYRMHRLWDALQLSTCSAFIKQYFLRLCIEYHKSH
ncbi:MAG: sugar diacid recognition domain-containing protein [Ruthenibacterium sp.]